MRQKDDAKAQDILQATLDEVRAVGLAGLSVESVARRAGIATGTVYIYFRGKEALLDALYRQSKQRFAAFVLSDDGGPLRPAFTRMTRAVLDYLSEHEAELVFMAQMANSPYVSAETRQSVELGLKPISALLERGKAEALLKPLDTGLMLAFLHGAVSALAPLAEGLSPGQRTLFQDQVANLCWDALKA